MTLRRLLHHWTTRLFAPDRLLRHKYEAFKELLRYDKRSLELISELEELGYAGAVTDWAAIPRLISALDWSVGSLIRSLTSMRPGGYKELERRHGQLAAELAAALPVFAGASEPPYALDMAQAAGQAELVGGKAAALGRVLQAGLPQPRGFVITTGAFNLFLSHNNLRHRLDELLAEVRLHGTADRLQEISRELTALIRQAEVPTQIREAIDERLAELRPAGGSGRWALRSSAVGEDGENSFAGQYVSLLDVAHADIPEVYKEIVAGKYAPQALAYRVRCGLADQETAMAVIVMEMIEAKTSGVMYTREKAAETAGDFLAVYAVAGAGARLVDGSAEPEVFRFPKGMGLHQDSGNSTPARLAEWGLRLEELFGGPQDIEWCEGLQGNCFILQCRPLQMFDEETGDAEPEPPEPELQPLISGGTIASPGVGSGRVFILDHEAQLVDVPDGSVLVSPTLPPSFAGILERLRAVVAEGGSRASHFASVAREYGLPVIVGLHGARSTLAQGETVTVDAGRGMINSGARQLPESRKKRIPPTPFSDRLTTLLRLISPLHLLDPAAPEFSQENCGSMHDLVRFAHEKGMAEMFSLIGPSGREMSGGKRLEGDLPLTLYVLDLGEGLEPAAAAKKVIDPADIASPLMRASWAGLANPTVAWHEGLAVLDWEEADRLSGGIVGLKSTVFGSYAAVAREYLHLVLRFGYHFAVLDAYGGADPEANYITFRFKGGGGNFANRLLRVRLIERILTWAGFTVATRGDLLDAGFQRRPLAEILGRLTLLGILQGKCRLLDMSLSEGTQLDEMVESFQAVLGRYLNSRSDQEGE